MDPTAAHGATRRSITWTASAIGLLGLGLGLATDAAAETVVSNLGETPSGTESAVLGQWFAGPFVTDGRSYELTSVTFTLDPGQFPEPQVSFARVYEDDGTGAPGALLTELVNPGGLAFGPPGDYLFAAPGGVVLDPNTRYLVSLGSQVPPPGAADQRAGWAYSSSAASAGPGSMPGGAFRSFDGGASWALPNPQRYLLFAVEAHVIVQDSGCVASTDAEIHALIDTLRTAGSAIAIDGSDADWTLFPMFSDAPGDLPGNPGQDLVAGAFAPLSDRVEILARTAGAPDQTAGAFAVQLELLGGPAADVQIILDPVTGQHTVILVDVQNQPILPPAGTISDPSFQIAFGADFIEVEIPYALLIPFLPDLALPDQRSWARAGFASLGGFAIIDFGPGTSSYRLLPTPYTLDPPLPANPNAPLSLALPVAGEWLVSQGAFGEFSHQTYWAYDFHIVDQSFSFSSPPGSLNNADYYAFGEPLFAPADGIVTQAVGSNPDVPPLDPMAAPFNIVALDVGSGFDVSMLHERQNSVIVNVSDPVLVGDPLAEVGNSGFSTSAHVHLEINEAGAPLGASVRGVELENVRVALNPAGGDPWARVCASWEVREGFLVRTFGPPADVPALGATALASLFALLGGAGCLALRRQSERGISAASRRRTP